jgi:hypothetical protein
MARTLRPVGIRRLEQATLGIGHLGLGRPDFETDSFEVIGLLSSTNRGRRSATACARHRI